MHILKKALKTIILDECIEKFFKYFIRNLLIPKRKNYNYGFIAVTEEVLYKLSYSNKRKFSDYVVEECIFKYNDYLWSGYISNRAKMSEDEMVDFLSHIVENIIWKK